MRATRIVSLLLALATIAAPAQAAQSINTPGYEGTTKVPKTRGGAEPTGKPAPVGVGPGLDPVVIVDAAGTAHTAWNVGSTLHYCRLKRGARGCDAEYAWPAGTLSWAPVILAYGDQVVILREDGQDAGGPVRAWVSDDGGTKFTSAGDIVGGPVPDVHGGVPAGEQDLALTSAAVYGPPGSERIALGYDEGWFQSLRPGAPAGPMVNLNPPGHEPIDGTGSVAASGSRVAMSLGGIVGSQGSTFVRVWNGTGDITDPGQWSNTNLRGGSLPQMGGGASGLWVESMQDAASRIVLQKVDGDGHLGSPLTLFSELVGNTSKPVVDAAGNVFSVWLTGNTLTHRIGDLVMRRVSANGRPSPLKIVVKGPLSADAARGKGINYASPVIGALPDGGGFVAAMRHRTNSDATIALLGFGTQAPTGVPGLGGVEGNSGPAELPPGVVQTCSRIEFSAVDIAGTSGCLLSAVGDREVKVAEGTIKINGLEIVPDPGVKIMLDARKRTINTSGSVVVQLRADKLVVPLFEGQLHLDLPSGDPDTTTAAPGCTGSKLLGFEAVKSKPLLLGFPIKGQIAVFLKEDSVCIPIALELPKALGGIRGNAVLEADNEHGLDVKSLDFGVPTIPLGPVLVQDLSVKYAGVEDEWTGKATVTFPPGWVLGASVSFKSGAFNGASVTLSPAPYPGVPLFTGVYLNRVTGGFKVDPLTLTVGARIGALPTKPPDGYAITVDGTATAVFGDPFTLSIHGTGALFGLSVATLDVVLNSDLYFSAAAHVNFDLSVLALEGDLKAYIDGPKGNFAGEISAQARVLGYQLAEAQAIISNIGTGVCGKVTILGVDLEATAGYRWGDSFPDASLGSCDLDEYRPETRRRDGRAVRYGFTVQAGTTLKSVRLTGDGGVPKVVLISPTGEHIDPASDPRAPMAVAADRNEVFIAIPKPQAGIWHLGLKAGSPDVAALASAVEQPKVQISAKVGGQGRKRTLDYELGDLGSRDVRFFEVSPAGERAIGVAPSDQGTLKFTSAPGKAGTRQIVAVVEQGGLPRERRVVAEYVAPPPARPAAVKGLKVRRAKGGAVIRWRGGSGATSFLVRADVSDGRRLVYVTKARHYRIRGLAPSARATIRVRGRSATGTLGKVRSAKLRAQRSARHRHTR